MVVSVRFKDERRKPLPPGNSRAAVDEFACSQPSESTIQATLARREDKKNGAASGGCAEPHENPNLTLIHETVANEYCSKES